MTAGKSNLPASVAARLLNREKQTGDVYETLFTSFCFERFLYRLGKSEARERFVLKGAMLLRPRFCAYPALLDFPPPEVLAYPREAVVAEKLEALVVLGERNSRIKDFFDLHHLASRFEFDRETLAEAVLRTFARRGTPIPAEPPIGLTPAYWENPSRPAQVRAFARRTGSAVGTDPAHYLSGVLGAFLLPVLDDLQRGVRRGGTWPPGGPWR